MSDIVLVKKSKGIALVTMNRPKQGNAMCMEMYPLLTAALNDATADKTIKVVVLTGAGKFFTTGADVAQAAKSMMEGGDVDDLKNNLRSGPIVLTQTIIDFPKILVAAVNGPVVGFPAGLLGLCDLVFAAESASYQTPFMHLGLVPEGASSHTIPRITGNAMAMDLLLTNRKLSAKEMVQCQIASRVLPNDGFLEKALTIIGRGAAASSAGSLLEAKRLIRKLNAGKVSRDYKEEADALVARFEGGEPMKRFAKLFMKMSERKSKL